MDPDLPNSSWRRTAAFRLGDLEIHPDSGEVRGRRGTERLRPLLVDVLLRLAANPGEVVRRETLLEEVWPRRMVNDEVLSRAIAELRTALGDDARQARYIETLPKIGYRLVAPVQPLQPAAPAPAAPAPQPAALPASAPRAASTSRARWVGTLVVAIVLAAAAIGLRVPPDPFADLERRLAAAQPFASDPALEVGPRFSPDGLRVAYALGEAGQGRVVVQSVDGVERRVLGAPGALQVSPVFFPDGRRIAYWRGPQRDCAIVEHDLQTGEERVLVDCRLYPRARFDLSPDGRKLAVVATVRPQFPAGIVLVDLQSGETKTLTAPEPGTGDDLFPRFSPDGARLAYFHGSESHRQLWIADLAAGTQAPAARYEGLSYGVAWLGPRGPLVVAADWLGFRALNLLDLETGQARLLGARGARFPDANARGDVVYENAIYAANVWRIDPSGATPPRTLWASTRYTSQPQLSPDGKRVAFVSNREGQDAIYVAPLDGEAARLALATGYRYIRPRWSADGRRLYAIRSPVGPQVAAQVVRIDVERGTSEVLEALGRAVSEVRESADGQWLYFGETSGHAMRLMRAPLARLDRSERLPVPLAAEFQLNRTSLVFSQPQLVGLTRCRLDGGACEQVDAAISDANRYEWALAEREVWYREMRSTATLARHDLEDKRALAPVVLPPGQVVVSIALDATATQVLVAREERTAIDLMLARR